MAASNEKVHFRLIQTPCCNTLLCYVNPRLPNFCSECGKSIFRDVKGCILASDEEAWLRVDFDKGTK
jgi:hypothetical protein